MAAFLLQHALQGWCPPLPVLRRLAFRTMHEIDRERSALRILRVHSARWTRRYGAILVSNGPVDLGCLSWSEV